MSTLNYGERYMKSDRFKRYCADLNLPLRDHLYLASFISSDLERFELYGAMLPAARVTTPVDFEVPDRQGTLDPKWNELIRLLRPNYEVAGHQHPFDHEFAAQNKFLNKPTNENFQPWRGLEVDPNTGEKIAVKVEHYYHYWQVYQVYAIQKYFPLFANQHQFTLLQTVREDHPTDSRWDTYWPKNLDNRFPLGKWAALFEPLSFYIHLYSVEEVQSHATADTGQGYSTLAGSDFADYKQRLKAHALLVQQQFNLNEAKLIEFAIELMRFYSKLKKDERQHLAAEVKLDLWYLRELMAFITGKSYEDLAEAINQQGGFYAKTDFRYIDEVLEVKEEAANVLNHYLAEYNQLFPTQPMTEVAVTELLDWLTNNGLFVIPYTIVQTVEYLGERRQFREISRFVATKNLATGLEDFLRYLHRILTGKVPTTESFYNLVQKIFKVQWGGSSLQTELDNVRIAVIGPFSNYVDEQLASVAYLSQSSSLKHVEYIRAFLIAYFVRNISAHRYPFRADQAPSLLYGYLGGQMIVSIIHCLLYTWSYAKQNRLV